MQATSTQSIPAPPVAVPPLDVRRTMSRRAWSTTTRVVTGTVFASALIAGVVVGVTAPATSPVQPAAPADPQVQADPAPSDDGAGTGVDTGPADRFDRTADGRGGRGGR
ncbi:hypothetical protein [Curtobacterium pusillum]|uniref:hypothetical protein n=1 Tax=Curtobacterium pusillum TaxID=69373 RepID=UPI00119F44BF|nr:hypothetical protein [Curtobacterium pusillum]